MVLWGTGRSISGDVLLVLATERIVGRAASTPAFERARDGARRSRREVWRAAEAIKCNTCLFLLQDLWSKVIGVGANDPQSQAIHRSTFSTEVRARSLPVCCAALLR